ncbi:MAG: radical SAM protein, partial [Candidatus Dormibacteria bacterium]
MGVEAGPRDIVWDITYACPLRCIHCYSESGRRPTRQLSHADMLRVANALIALRPQGIVLSGGEPLTVKGIFDVVERIARARIPVILYSSGWSLQPSMIPDILGMVTRLSVSLDGATPDVHDRIRGRAG